VENTLWDVVTSPGKTERMTLDQLDASFQAGAISEGTLVREPGTNDWRPLYEVAGLEPPNMAPLTPEAPQPGDVVQHTPSPVSNVNIPPPIALAASAHSTPTAVASLKSTINGGGFIQSTGVAETNPAATNGQAAPHMPPVGSAGSSVNDAPKTQPFSPSPSTTASASEESPKVRVPLPSRAADVEASGSTTEPRPSLPARTRTAPKTSKPPATAPRRTGPPTSRTARGVPLPSVVPKDDDLIGLNHVAPGVSPSLNQPHQPKAPAAALSSNPRPLTPPKTTSRRVSAPPAAISSGNGSRSRRAPPSILSAPAPTAATLTPPPPPLHATQPSAPPSPVQTKPRSVPPPLAPAPGSIPPPSSTSLTHNHHPNPELAPWDVGGGLSHAPLAFNDNPLADAPRPQTAPGVWGGGVQVLPVPVAITHPQHALPPSPPPFAEASSVGHAQQKRVNAPPLPAHAFAHLTPGAPGIISPSPVGGAPHQSFQPPRALGVAEAPAPHSAAPATANPNSLYDALGFANRLEEASPFASASSLAPRSTSDASPSGISWAELGFWVAATALAGFIVLQRHGLTLEWFGPRANSAYSQFEKSVFGAPSVDTVPGVKALLKELAAEHGDSNARAVPRRGQQD
jgi:hypothetical protein